MRILNILNSGWAIPTGSIRLFNKHQQQQQQLTLQYSYNIE